MSDNDKRELLTKSAENVNGASASDTAGNSGDVAKLREALELARLYISLGPKAQSRAYVKDGEAVMLFAIEVLDEISAALSAPPRNCERFATADEALKAQEQMFNDSNFANGECKLGCPECDNPRVGCKIAWLFAHATEKEGGAE